MINTQLGAVLNAGVATANTGGNTAIGNESAQQRGPHPGHRDRGRQRHAPTSSPARIVGSNNGEASNSSDGLATIATGAAAATGNESGTNLRQEANGAIDGDGLVLNTQPALVANVGLASADSGNNTATGNTSTNDADVEQDVFISSDNTGDRQPGGRHRHGLERRHRVQRVRR